MALYLLRRVGQMAIVFFGVTLVIFGAVWLLPGDPIQSLAGGQPISPSTEAALRDRYNLDDPLIVQYAKYIGGLTTGNLGVDFNQRPIADQLARRWPVTIQLALTAWVIEVVLGLGLGALAAIRHRKIPDYVVLIFSMILISIPVFVLGYVAQLVLGVRLGLFPVAGTAAGWPASYLLPAAVLAAFGTASIIRVFRSSVVENLRSDYARTARGKGLTELQVFRGHIFKNSFIPALTLLGIELGYLLAGTVIIEGIFNLPGVGNLLYQSVLRQDGLVVVAVSSTLVLVFLVINLVIDVLYGVLDPRISK